jgi:hypothetical protein
LVAGAPSTTTAITGVADNVGLIQGQVANGAATDDTTLTFTGSLSAALAVGETLRIFSVTPSPFPFGNNITTLLGNATVDNTARTWTFTSTLPDTAGTNYSITARVADAAGKLGASSAARSFTLDTTPPDFTTDTAAPQLTRAALSATSINLSQAGAGPLSLTLGATDNLSGFDSAQFRFSSPSGNTSRTFFVDGFLSGSDLNGSFVGSINLDPNAEAGTWTLSSVSLDDQAGNSRDAFGAAELNALLPGLGSLSFSVINPAADSAAPQLTRAALSATSINLSQPGAGPLSLTIGATDNLSGFDSGSFSFRSPSGNTSRTFFVDEFLSGSDLSGSFVGSINLGPSTFGPSAEAGTWTLSNVFLDDQAGNSRSASTTTELNALLPGLGSLSFQVLTGTPPLPSIVITGVADNSGAVQGQVANGGRTDDLTPTITGTIPAALLAGETLRIFNGATLLGSATVDDTTRTWTFTPTLPPTAGTSYSITARVADAAGNLGVASAARTFTLRSAPQATTAAITGVADDVGIIQGAVAAAGVTDDLTPTISGTITAALTAGQTLRIFNGASLLGGATVDNTARTWTFTPTLPATARSNYSITARVADAAGNLGVASAARTFTLDTTALGACCA